MNHRNQLTCVLIILAALVAMIGCGSQIKPSSGAPRSDDVERVSQVRRELRSACGQLRLANSDPKTGRDLLADATGTTGEALIAWQQIRKDYESSPPPAYAAHPRWSQAAGEIEYGIEQMLNLARAAKPSESFLACGRTCGLFVTLNEQAGVRRTSDVLFHFRKAAKPLAEPAREGDYGQLAEALPQLLELSRRAAADPVGGAAPQALRRNALAAFLSAVDQYAAAVQDRQAKVGSAYTNMMRAMEEAYDAYL